MAGIVGSAFEEQGWYRALELGERARIPGNPVLPSDPERASRRLERWRSQEPFSGGNLFARRLALANLEEDGFRTLLGEPDEALARRIRRAAIPPAWLTTLSEAFLQSHGDPFPLPAPSPGEGASQPGVPPRRPSPHECGLDPPPGWGAGAGGPVSGIAVRCRNHSQASRLPALLRAAAPPRPHPGAGAPSRLPGRAARGGDPGGALRGFHPAVAGPGDRPRSPTALSRARPSGRRDGGPLGPHQPRIPGAPGRGLGGPEVLLRAGPRARPSRRDPGRAGRLPPRRPVGADGHVRLGPEARL